MLDRNKKVVVFGASGMVGSALVKTLQDNGFTNILCPNRKTVQLESQQYVIEYFNTIKPDYVFLAAAKVGGIIGNQTQPATFGYENCQIALNVINACHLNSVEKLLYLGSSCIFPRLCKQPIKEEYLLTGELEETNHMYALAKIFGLKLCDAYRTQHGCNFISCMPCNLYGPNDVFDQTNGHVIPSLLMRFHAAKINNSKSVTCWGTGNPMREFLHVSDCANACLFLMDNYNDKGPINVGYGSDITLKDLAEKIKVVVGFEGEILWDAEKPDGTPRKIVDSSKLNSLGWNPSIDFDKGLKSTYEWFLNNQNNLRGNH